jgi:hypothetical protein
VGGASFILDPKAAFNQCKSGHFPFQGTKCSLRAQAILTKKNPGK